MAETPPRHPYESAGESPPAPGTGRSYATGRIGARHSQPHSRRLVARHQERHPRPAPASLVPHPNRAPAHAIHQQGDAVGMALKVGDRVEVHSTFEDTWSRGFEIVDVVDGGFTLRRV